MLATIWTFLNSPLGTILVTSAVGWIFKKTIDSATRRQQIQQYAEVAFHVAEGLHAPGVEKYKLFIETIVNALKAASLPELSANEVMQLQNLASTKAMLQKPKAKVPPPLPPP